MRNKLAPIFVAVVVLLAVSVPLFAHHGNAAYDTAKTVTVKGTVTDYIWTNPHVFVKVDAKDDSAVRFYQRYRFRFLVEGGRRLFIPMAEIAKLFS